MLRETVLTVFLFANGLIEGHSLREEKDFVCTVKNGYFPNPKNCMKYYLCENYMVKNIACPSENGIQLLYDSQKIWCDYPERVNCGSRPICNENDEDCKPQNEIVPECKEDGFFPDMENCIKYYQCYAGARVNHTCHKVNGIQLLYNSGAVMCDWADRVDCGERPICDSNNQNCKGNKGFTCKENWYYPDPKNCTKYYWCFNGSLKSFACSKKQGIQKYFNVESGQCELSETVNCGNRPF